ncbi:MAG TPA: hypothetical protein VGU90_06950 [Terriglobales bacterium]|nr:hypothetical protein [Terriglobales bacterium]
MTNVNPTSFSASNYGAAAAPARERTESMPAEHREVFKETPLVHKNVTYGLPCSNCKTYYGADLPACPICGNKQRVSPVEPLTEVVPAEQLPDPQQLEQERERFLKEFNSQVIASPLPPDLPAQSQNCNHVENHSSMPEPATICQGCYDRLQERVDVLEAAMHMDTKEAAQIVYDAVWSDPSDPTKTYQNAAQALLTELRRRSGVPQVFGPLQPPMN